MPSYHKKISINRIIDANLNRAKEGLRVCEEIARFVLNNRKLTSQFKTIRHNLDAIARGLPVNSFDLLSQRQSLTDVGKKIYINELKRKNVRDIFFASMQRVKESVRVLEEFTKLINRNTAIKFKKLRYDTYEVEKQAYMRISASCSPPLK